MHTRPTQISIQLGWAFGSLALMHSTALAQVSLERVEITGSSIKRVDAETVQPITIIKAEDLARQGVTSIEQALGRLAANQSTFATSNAVGGTTGGKAEVDLRGLSGPFNGNANKTLVLLDGRRIANHPFDAAAVDLHAIPFGALDRIEVLRDGASAIYGTDAIGGVVNFILKKNYSGAEVSADISQPQKSGGGSVRRASASGGYGNISADGFNVMGSLDMRKQRVLLAADRKFSQSGIVAGDVDSGTSGSSFPGDLNGFEPSLAAGCSPPNSIPSNDGSACRYDFSRAVDALPENQQLTALVRGSLALTPRHTLSAEYTYARNEIQAQVAPTPINDLMPTTSPFFPAGATPTPGGIVNINNPGADPGNPNRLPGGVANWRTVPAGKRTSGNVTETDRALLDLSGSIGNWEYKTGAGHTTSKSVESVKRGYVNEGIIQQGVFDGIINPFGAQTAAGDAAISSAQISAPVQIGKNTQDFADIRFTGDVLQLPAGPMTLAIGAEFRREKSFFVATDINAELINSLGIDPDSDTAGARDTKALFVELAIPAAKGLDLTAAARFDHSSDFGSTFNPKVGLRFQPVREFMLRGQYSKGFRAPTLYEIYQPASLTFTTDNYNDPLLCPTGTAVGGATPGVVCQQQVLQRQAGPAGLGLPARNLKPEKSNTFTIGTVIEPVQVVSMSLDYWNITVKNLINGLPEQSVFGDPVKYAGRFVRCSALPLTGAGISRDDIDVCLNLPTFDPIAYIDVPNENLGTVKTSGLDISLLWRAYAGELGKLTAGIDGTYVASYKYQRESGGVYINAVGRYSDNSPVFRWQHTATLNWSTEAWAVNFNQRYKAGYTDQTDSNRVKSYALYDVAGTWKGIKGLSVTASVANLFDQDPPVSNQTTTFQRGYDPRFTDPLGRTLGLRVAYAF